MARILVVDDDRSIRRTLEKYLEGLGYEVLTASTGPEGKELMLSEAPDLVLLDLNLPGMNGQEILEALHAEGRLPCTVVISARGDMRSTIQAIQHGAYDYLHSRWGDVVLGIDINEDYVARHREAGRNVTHGDATDADFWARAERSGRVKLALLAFSDHKSNMAVARLLREQKFDLQLASVAHYPDHESALREAGVNAVFNFYASAGESFAEHVVENFGDMITAEPVQAAQAG